MRQHVAKVKECNSKSTKTSSHFDIPLPTKGRYYPRKLLRLKKTSLEEEPAQEVNLVQEAEDPVEKEDQIAAPCHAANHSDSEDEALCTEGGAMGIIFDEFDRPVVSPKGPPNKKNISSKKKKR
ncbi:hypothetical protein U1Q18_036417 [Sarracenia purpurea var. burkii]